MHVLHFIRILEVFSLLLAVLLAGTVSVFRLEPQVLDELCEKLTANDPTLDAVFLGDANIGEEGARQLGAAAEYNTALKALHIWGNGVGDAGVGDLAALLARPGGVGLRTLDLSNNGIADRGALALAAALRLARHDSPLRVLDLSGNPDLTEASARELAEAIVSATANAAPTGDEDGAITLHLRRNTGLGTEGGMRALAPVLGCVGELELAGASIGDLGAQAIADAMTREGGGGCGALRSLDLSDNLITDAGGVALAAAARACPQLRTLNLRGNSLADGSAAALAAALSDPRGVSSAAATLSDGSSLRPSQTLSLQALDLSFNRVGSAGAIVLAAAMPRATALATLNLSYNRIGSEGVAALDRAVRAAAGAGLRLAAVEVWGNDFRGGVAVDHGASGARSPPSVPSADAHYPYS